MYLSKLELFGFKSFAAKTTINFTRAITGIVGPNGCGKTNIVDALRWCLGEQKSSTLRSDKMENVIFNGTRNRKPMGMCEVSMILQNDKGILPSDFTEINITRRLYRSGESEYLLNKNLCRLKDITNLFMDTGMGTNAYSVIELKMVETILSNKADERRNMFEEAAGVNKFKHRKRLALKKLDEVKADLTRVNDIVSEIEKNVRSLERQAQRADKYFEIQTILKDLELNLSERQFLVYTNDVNTNNNKIILLNNNRDDVDKEIREQENELIKINETINQIEEKLTAKRQEKLDKSNEINRLSQNISITNERIKFLEISIENYNQDIEELFSQDVDLNKVIEDNRNKVEDLKVVISSLENFIEEDDKNIQAERITLNEKKSELKKLTDVSIQVHKEINLQENKIETQKDKQIKNQAEMEIYSDRINKLTIDLAKSAGYLEELLTEKDTTKSKLLEYEELLVQKQNEKNELESQLNLLRQKELEIKSTTNELINRSEFLKEIITNLEGISSGSKALLTNDSWKKQEKILLADAGNTDENYKYAIDSALKNVLSNFLIENLNDLNSAIEYLKNNDLGKAAFYLNSLSKQSEKGLIQKLYNRSINKKSKKIERENSFIVWASDIVNTSKKWKSYFDKLLQNIAIVNDISSAINLCSNYPGFSFVTIEGDIVKSSGVIEAGSLPKADDTVFGRKEILENILIEIPKLDSELEKLRVVIQEIEDKLSKIELKAISEQGRIILNDLNNIEKQISQFEFEQEKVKSEIENSQTSIQELTNENGLLDETNSKAEVELQKLSERNKELEDEIQSATEYVKFLEEEFNTSIENHNEKKLSLERNKGILQNSLNTITASETTRENIKNKIAKLRDDCLKSQNNITELTDEIKIFQDELEQLNRQFQIIASEENEINNQIQKIKHSSAEQVNRLNQFRNKRQEISEKIHLIDMELQRINFKIETLQNHIKEEYNIELSLKEFDNLDTFDFQETTNQVNELKNKIKKIGPVNPLAYTEYQEEKERLEFLQKQRDDLIESEKDLIKTIEEINTTAIALFNETFEKIKESFKKIFRTLFDPGDEADLILEEGVDPLEAKIEIIAKPKGKRPTSIDLLSGGEKTLTAIALLFAIYLVKPSPFCVLDEVDAPLDDANIDRFCRLLKEFSDKSQFIIVTHNKRTMESTENLYGVTMQEEGVSKLVGVQFNEEIQATG
ncbi:MAG: chromosome segregation protein SMC [Ignavibacteriales bacterium]|nr:chromosome segregation protein SMC [Ignavibacteriales bacterium]